MFITFEGPDGSGKTTQIERLAAFLRQAGRTVYHTREPGGTPIGDQIRAVLLDNLDNTMMTGPAEALLFSASRAQHVGEVIRPALAAGRLVLCDRYADSTLAYQGYGHGLDLEALQAITAFATGGLVPDLTFFFDCAPEVGLARRQGSGESLDRLDQLALAFHQRVYAGFWSLIERDPARWVVIDATPEPDAVFAQVMRALGERGVA